MNITDRSLEEHGDADIAGYLEACGFEVGPDSSIFRETSETDQMPQPLYVHHDLELVNLIVNELGEDSVGFTSPVGTGKTALREILLREIGSQDQFIMTHLEGESLTKRQLMARVFETILEEGYEYDRSNYGQITDGIPWSTTDLIQALSEVTTKVRASSGGRKQFVVIVDQIERYDERQLQGLQSLIDKGVDLLMMGVPRGEQKVRKELPALHSRVYWLDRPIKSFAPGHTAEYVARSLSYYADGGPYEGPEFRTDEAFADGPGTFTSFDSFVQTATLGPFTPDTIQEITERTGGNPRLVKEVCRHALVEAARTWATGDEEATAVEIDTELVADLPIEQQAAALTPAQ